MTRNEIVSFLHDTFNYRKKDLSTIKGIIDCAYREGYIVEKNGKDDFSIKEKFAISDFSKPFVIDRTMPEDLNEWEVCNGVPVDNIVNQIWRGGFFDYGLWCYMVNQEDNCYLNLEQMVPNGYKNIEGLVKSFDIMTSGGYFEEKDDCIIFHMYPGEGCGYSLEYMEDKIKRMAPIKY